jgi:hypothetical protein
MASRPSSVAIQLAKKRRENAIARWYDSEVDALRGLELAHKDYNTAVAALDSLRAEKLVDAMNTLPPLPSRSLNGNIRVGLVGPNPELPESFRPVPNIPNMRTGVEQTFSKVFASSFRELPNLLIDSFTGNGSWKGGVRALGVTFTNNLFGEEGAFSSVTQKLSGALGKGLGKVFGGSVGKALGEGISSFLPGIGAFLAPLAEAAIGKLRKLMGGPSEDELKGRKLVAQFEDTLAKSLTGIQRAEAGTDKWKQTTIGVREMYLKAGLSIEDARKATERLWAASKQGEEAVKAVIEQINKTRELADARTQLKDVEKQLAGQQLQNASAILAVIKGQQNGVALTGRELKDFGAIAVASFGAALKAGMSFAEALQQVGPGLADLQDALQRAGVASDDAFVGILARLGKIQQQNPTLVAGIGAMVYYPDPDVRRALVRVLQRLSTPDAMEIAERFLYDTDPGVRQTAIQVLGDFGWSRAIARPLELVEDGPEAEMEAACIALGKLKAESAVDPLYRILAGKSKVFGLARKTASDLLRARAAWALGHIDSPAARNRLRGFQDDPVPLIRDLAAASVKA